MCLILKLTALFFIPEIFFGGSEGGKKNRSVIRAKETCRKQCTVI